MLFINGKLSLRDEAACLKTNKNDANTISESESQKNDHISGHNTAAGVLMRRVGACSDNQHSSQEGSALGRDTWFQLRSPIRLAFRGE